LRLKPAHSNCGGRRWLQEDPKGDPQENGSCGGTPPTRECPGSAVTGRGSRSSILASVDGVSSGSIGRSGGNSRDELPAGLSSKTEPTANGPRSYRHGFQYPQRLRCSPTGSHGRLAKFASEDLNRSWTSLNINLLNCTPFRSSSSWRPTGLNKDGDYQPITIAPCGQIPTLRIPASRAMLISRPRARRPQSVASGNRLFLRSIIAHRMCHCDVASWTCCVLVLVCE